MQTKTLVISLPAAVPAYWRMWLAVCFAFCLALLTVQSAWAADFEVDTVLDGVDSDLTDGICLNVTVVVGGACTLRAAVQQANFTPLVPDTIVLPAGTYILTLENPSDNAEDEAVSGDLDITSNITIEGFDAKTTIVEAKADLHDRIFHLVGEDAVLGLHRLTVRNGNTTELNGEQDGGGILNGGGLLEGLELVVSDNTSPSFGGGIMAIGTKTTTLHRCTINGNTAVGSNGRGGGIFHGQNHVMLIANCTISDNEAESRGGGIDISNNSNLATIVNTTIANNRLHDPEQGAGIYMGNNTEIELYSTIVADNFANIIVTPVANDCYGQFDVLDFSLVEVLAPGNDCILAGDGESNSSFLGSDDPELGPLADNGGSLQTHALLEGSIAIDAGSQLETGSGDSACYATDARDVVRPSGEYCDMGAYEYETPETLAYIFMPKLDK